MSPRFTEGSRDDAESSSGSPASETSRVPDVDGSALASLVAAVTGGPGQRSLTRAERRRAKREFRQATVLWILYMALAALMASNLIMILQGGGVYPLWLPSSILVVAVLELMFMIYTFAMLSRFDDSIYQTLINAVTLTFSELPRSLEMAVITLVPLIAFFRASILLPLLVLFGLSVPGYACAIVYDPIFKKIEKQIWEDENAEYPDDEANE